MRNNVQNTAVLQLLRVFYLGIFICSVTLSNFSPTLGKSIVIKLIH